jgi:acyl-CoA thioesterase
MENEMALFDFRKLRRSKDDYIAAFEKGDRLGAMIGAKCVSLSESECIYIYEVSAQHYNPNGVLHGGALFTVADSSQGMFMHYILDERFTGAVTGTATIRYEKPLRDGRVEVRTFLQRQEGRKYFLRSEASQHGERVAWLEEIWIALE